MIKRLAALLLALSLGGCASGGYGLMDEIMDTWSGATVDDVIKQWGYPHEERVIAGKKLLLWHRDVQLTMPGFATTTGTVNRYGGVATYQGTTTYSGGGTSNWSCVRILEVDSKNTVIGWQWDGNNCPFLEAGPYSKWRRVK